MNPLLDIRHVTKRYAAHTALKDVSIQVPEGSIFGLLGPNGAGKTSLIRIVNQITGPDEGEIFFQNQKLNPSHISAIGYLPEERGLYKKMEVGEQAVYLAQLKGLSKRDALNKLKYWFEKFELQSWWKKKIEELSKGMQQKVQFIITVLHEPRLLILDEPFTGFDPINAELIKNELLGLRKKGTTIMLSTHRMESVEQMCDYIALINRAEKVLDGSLGEIRKKYKSDTYELAFSGNNIAFANALWTGFEIIESLQEDGFMRTKIKLLNGHTTNDLLQSILPHVQVHSLKELIPTMNDIFISVAGKQNSAEE